MANDLREYLDSLGLKEEAIDKAVELAVPDTFRKDLAEMGGRLKEQDTELSELRPLKEAPKREAAAGRFGLKYETGPKYLRDVFDKIPLKELDNEEFVSQHLREHDIEVTAPTQQPTGGTTKAEQIVTATSQLGGGQPPAPETYEAAVAGAKSQEELDQIYVRYGKEPATT